MRLGVTGGIGSGKSTVCGLLAKKGIPLIDADAISRARVDVGERLSDRHDLLRDLDRARWSFLCSLDRIRRPSPRHDFGLRLEPLVEVGEV
jgi:broad-specificity NMP kinase